MPIRKILKRPRTPFLYVRNALYEKNRRHNKISKQRKEKPQKLEKLIKTENSRQREKIKFLIGK